MKEDFSTIYGWPKSAWANIFHTLVYRTISTFYYAVLFFNSLDLILSR